MDSTQMDDALIIFQDGKTFGTFQSNGESYQFYTLDNGEQVLLEVDSPYSTLLK